MATFKDTTGREWTLEIPNFGEVARLRKEGLFDLNRASHDSGTMFDLLHGDPEQLLRTAHAIAKSPVPFDDLIAAVDADVLDSVRGAMLEAITGFFHHRRAAELLPRFAEVLLSRDGLKTSDSSSPASSE